MMVELPAPPASVHGLLSINIIRCHPLWFFWENHGKEYGEPGRFGGIAHRQSHTPRFDNLCGGAYFALTT